MKKLLLFIMTVATMMVLAISVSAAVIYKTESGEELFRYEKNSSSVISSYTGAFPKTDSEGNALIWYYSSSKSEDGNTVVTAKSFKTLGQEGDVYGALDAKGKYTVTGVDGNKIISLNLPDNMGIKTVGINFNGGYTGTFPRDSHILFAYLPNTLEETSTYAGGGGWTVERVFQYTPLLECYFSDLDTSNSKHLKGIGNFDFYGCRNLRVCKLPYGLETIFGATDKNSGPAFRECYNLKEIVIPNTVTSIGPMAFESSGLVTLRLGENTAMSYSPQAFNSISSLRYVYMSGKNAISGNYIFNTGAKDMVFFFAGTESDYLALKSSLGANNAKFTGATTIEWDSTKSDQYYMTKATEEEKCYIVLNYGRCEAFYGGHTWQGTESVKVNSYLEAIKIGDTCTVCQGTNTIQTIAPIFTWLGFSKATYGESLSITQCFLVDKDSVEAYIAYAPDFDYGVLATLNAFGDAITPEVGDANVITGAFDKNANSYLDIKVTGIPLDKTDALLVFCVYVTVGDKMYYLDNGKSGESVIGVSYGEI